jgi:hypothetical protein
MRLRLTPVRPAFLFQPPPMEMEVPFIPAAGGWIALDCEFYVIDRVSCGFEQGMPVYSVRATSGPMLGG